MNKLFQIINYVRLALCLLLMPAALAVNVATAQTTPTDGDWSFQYVILTNTPEAALMVRVGDIDNLGFGWPAGFDPFSGNSTPVHAFPWAVDPADTPGTDRIMVVTSFDYTGNPPSD